MVEFGERKNMTIDLKVRYVKKMALTLIYCDV